MYTVVSAKGISKQPQSRWGDIDVSTLAVFEIFNAYREVYLTLEANFTPDPIYVDLNVFRAKYSSFTGTIDDMLTDNGNETFETVPSIPTKGTRFALFQDMYRAGYFIEITGRNSTPDSGIPRENKIDLRIHRDQPVTSMQDVFDYCMVCVNGYWHMTDTDGDYLYVHDAAKSSMKSRHNSIGMWSFRNIGKIKQVPITSDMIYKQSANSKLYQKTFIQLDPSIVTTGKTVLLVLGGYLVLPNPEVFHPTGNNVFSITTNRIPLLERFYESRDYLDLDSLGLDASSTNPTIVNTNQFFSDAVLEKYFTLSQSFFVIIDTPEIFTNKLHIENTGFPGMFRSGFEPQYPLITGRGRCSVYWKQLEDGLYSINVVDSYLNQRLFNDLPNNKKLNVAASKPPTGPDIHGSGYLLELGSDFVVV